MTSIEFSAKLLEVAVIGRDSGLEVPGLAAEIAAREEELREMRDGEAEFERGLVEKFGVEGWGCAVSGEEKLSWFACLVHL